MIRFAGPGDESTGRRSSFSSPRVPEANWITAAPTKTNNN